MSDEKLDILIAMAAEVGMVVIKKDDLAALRAENEKLRQCRGPMFSLRDRS